MAIINTEIWDGPDWDTMELQQKPTGHGYGAGEDFDFERDTMDEARAQLAMLAALPGSPLDDALRAGRVSLVGSGTGSPGIDLRHVGEELDRSASGARWILFVGQGRGVETNWTTRFRCPVFRAAVVKDEHVAREIGASPGAPIFRYVG